MNVVVDPSVVYPGYEAVRFGFVERGDAYMDYTNGQATVKRDPLGFPHVRLIVRKATSPQPPLVTVRRATKEEMAPMLKDIGVIQ